MRVNDAGLVSDHRLVIADVRGSTASPRSCSNYTAYQCDSARNLSSLSWSRATRHSTILHHYGSVRRLPTRCHHLAPSASIVRQLMKCVVKARLHDTTGCQTVVKPVVQPFDNRLHVCLHDAAGGCPTGCSVVQPARQPNASCKQTSNRLDVCIHDTTCCPTCCQTGFTIGLTTGCIA